MKRKLREVGQEGATHMSLWITRDIWAGYNFPVDHCKFIFKPRLKCKCIKNSDKGRTKWSN